MTVRRYAGVLAFDGDSVALVRESYPTWGGSYWNVPSGSVESGEDPATGAARELAEEIGLVIPAESLSVVSTSTNRTGDRTSQSWNFVGHAADPHLQVDDPDELIEQAAWFTRADAIRELSRLPYAPLREPAVAYLSGTAEWTVAHWEFTEGVLQD
ncbi:NUDIX hydrolase [Flexivirga oryzae]|uniref:ADP-ribose pyrophosphatase YjhB (NUDIX family) n=1 Tax=Flexivirga oryzae TaxID=1794944 RepID=A0A839NCP3_9MICO|nr:NUDIX hydrolase [Flexivirga oryzae]MBB2894073.1 ADP-ribose pyrophosphatase YjhB (NUDIX family) [Flexivirga oryzae]